MSTSLYQNKLKALITHALGIEAERVESFKVLHTPWGATRLIPRDTPPESHDIAVLIEDDNYSVFAAVILTYKRNSGQKLHLFVGGEDAQERAAHFARWCKHFSIDADVYVATKAPAVRVDVGEITQIEPPVIRDQLKELIDGAGVTLVSDHGAATIEYLGLEIGRITGIGDEQRLDVGVGAYDQGAFAVMNPGLDNAESLYVVLNQIRETRNAQAAPSPIKRMSKHRWVLAELIAEPQLLDLDELVAVESYKARGGIEDESVALAVGISKADQSKTIVGVISGIDLLSVVAMVDIAILHGCDKAILVTQRKDRHNALSELSAVAPINFTYFDSDGLGADS